MSRRTGVSLAVCAALLLMAGTASAQVVPPYGIDTPRFGPGYRPQLNPYLNLAPNLINGTSINGTINPGLNYFLRTIPELDRRATNQVYGSAILGLEQQALAPTPPATADVDLFTPTPATGHTTAFQYTGGYFPTRGGRAAGPTTYQRPPAAK